MNKAELAARIAERIGVPKKTAEDFIEAFEYTVIKALVNGEEVTIAGFGTFSARLRAGRLGVNPQNPSEKIQIPSVVVPKFKAGKALKDSLKGKREVV
jgi:DNA-binding protein HU-beta